MRLTALAAVAVAAIVLVSGCAPAPVEPLKPVTPIPERSDRLFETPEEALAAAEAAYAEYQAMANLIAAEGGKDPERIAPYVTEEFLETELKGYAIYSENQVRTEGDMTFDSMRMQQFFTVSEGHTYVAVYACIDVSSTRVINSAGADVTPDRPDRVLVEVQFEARGPEPIEMLVAGSDVWDETLPC